MHSTKELNSPKAISSLAAQPDIWALDNFVSLMILKPELIEIAMIPRIIHGHESEAAQLFNCIQTVCVMN